MWPFILSGLFGGLVAIGELVTRYRDEPGKVFQVTSAWFYILLNVLAGSLAYHLINTFGWFETVIDPSSQAFVKVTAAGFGSMTILRSSFVNLKVEGRLVPLGPSALLTSLLAVADRGVDRVRAHSRSQTARRLMKEVSFEKAKDPLSAYCLALLQNASPQEQQELRDAVESVGNRAGLTDGQKSLTLGLLLMNLAGPRALESAIEALGDEISVTGDPP